MNDEFGAMIAIWGTLATSIIALAVAFPISFGIALFLTEICPAWLRRPLGTAVELLAGVPSIIYGMWGLFVFAPLFADHVQPLLKETIGQLPVIGRLFQGPTMGIGILTAGLILAIMIIPFIASVMRDVFEIVPTVLKESAYGLGCTTLGSGAQGRAALHPQRRGRRRHAGPGPRAGRDDGRDLRDRQCALAVGIAVLAGQLDFLDAGQRICRSGHARCMSSSLFALALILFGITFIVLSAAKTDAGRHVPQGRHEIR